MEGAHGDGGGNKENTLSHGKAPLDLVFKAVLADERATQEFLKFTQTEFSSENLEFYLVRQHVCTCGRPGPTPESCGCGRGRSWSLGVGVPACGPAVVAVASVVSLSCRPPRGLAGPGLVVWQLVWPGQRARALLLLLAAALMRMGSLAQAVRGFKERCKADGNPLLHAEGERRRSGWQEWTSSGRSGPAPHMAGGPGPWGQFWPYSGLGVRLWAMVLGKGPARPGEYWRGVLQGCSGGDGVGRKACPGEGLWAAMGALRITGKARVRLG